MGAAKQAVRKHYRYPRAEYGSGGIYSFIILVGVLVPSLQTSECSYRTQTSLLSDQVHLFSSRCKELKYSKELPSISIIFIFVNEALSVILRSVHSAVNHTPTHLLKEIILVDDNSDEGKAAAAFHMG